MIPDRPTRPATINSAPVRLMINRNLLDNENFVVGSHQFLCEFSISLMRNWELKLVQNWIMQPLMMQTAFSYLIWSIVEQERYCECTHIVTCEFISDSVNFRYQKYHHHSTLYSVSCFKRCIFNCCCSEYLDGQRASAESKYGCNSCRSSTVLEIRSVLSLLYVSMRWSGLRNTLTIHFTFSSSFGNCFWTMK